MSDDNVPKPAPGQIGDHGFKTAERDLTPSINGAPVHDLGKEQIVERKTLKLRDVSEQDDTAPNLNKKGRGWKISEKRLDALHDRAREMRRHPSEAHKALAARFAKEDFGKFKFQKQVVIGSAIMDFASHPLGLAIDIEEPDATDLEKRRDKSLAAVGIEIVRIPAVDILADMQGSMEIIFAAMNARYREKQERRRAAPRPGGSRQERPQRRHD